MKVGSVAEVVEDGVSGFVRRSFRDFIDCVGAVGTLDRRRCREYAESRFSGKVMTDGYEAVYGKLTSSVGNAPSAGVSTRTA